MPLFMESRHVHMLFLFNIMFVLIHVTDLPPFVCCLFIYSLIHMNLSMDDGGRSVQQQWRSNVLAFTSPAVVVSTPVGTNIGQNGIIFRPTVREWTFKRNYLKFHFLYANQDNFKDMKTRTYLPFSQYVTCLGEENDKITIDCILTEITKLLQWRCQKCCASVTNTFHGVTVVGWLEHQRCRFSVLFCKKKKRRQNCQFPWGAMEPP